MSSVLHIHYEKTGRPVNGIVAGSTGVQPVTGKDYFFGSGDTLTSLP